ncbi:MAG: hypothetical protein RKE49_08085 [Oceanicaulis sp.]
MAFVLTAFLCAACAPDTSARLLAGPEVPRVDGRIDQDFSDAFLDAFKTHNQIAVSSTGGETHQALALARVLAPRRLHLIIDDYCFSACASLLAPAADSIEFGPDAMFGVHDSPAMARAVYVRDFGRDDDCYVRSGGAHREMYAWAGRNPRFPDEVFERLEPLPARAVDIGGDCPRIEYGLTHQWWFPTSDQLRDLMGLEFTGTICADDPDCMRRRLRALRMEGTVMVGEEIWTLPLE